MGVFSSKYDPPEDLRKRYPLSRIDENNNQDKQRSLLLENARASRYLDIFDPDINGLKLRKAFEDAENNKPFYEKHPYMTALGVSALVLGTASAISYSDRRRHSRNIKRRRSFGAVKKRRHSRTSH